METVAVRGIPSIMFFVSVLVDDEHQISDPVPATWEGTLGTNPGFHDVVALSTGEELRHSH